MNWIKINENPPSFTNGDKGQIYLFLINEITPIVGKLFNDSKYGLRVSAYEDYYDLNTYTHWCEIKLPNN